MLKALVTLLWPAGLAVIVGIGALLASRTPAANSRRRGRDGEDGRGGQPGLGPRSPGLGPRSPGVRSAVARFLLTLVAGIALVYLAGVLIGLIAVHAGPHIDEPIWRWTVSHQVHGWASVMKKATQTAATFTAISAAVTAAVCLVFVWRRDRWLPAVALGTLIVADHYLTTALTDTFNRVPPPLTGGTFPSGASDRAVAFYGLIAFLLWRAVSGRRKAAIWAGTTVAALAFTEAYSRGYLALHWFTDILSGLLYGTLLLTAFIFAVKAAVSGAPGIAPAGQAADAGATAAGAAGAGATAASAGAGTHRTGTRAAGMPGAGTGVPVANVTGARARPATPAVGPHPAAGEGVA
jgi:membrane-associated phospholipid phosphatase